MTASFDLAGALFRIATHAVTPSVYHEVASSRFVAAMLPPYPIGLELRYSTKHGCLMFTEQVCTISSKCPTPENNRNW